jgi:Fe(3+) dicitrate transport protein
MTSIPFERASLKTLGCLICCAAGASHADSLTSADVSVLEEVVVVGVETDLQDISGSVAILDEKDLDAFDYVDLGKLLSAVPGVYVRGEDGFGLRPNIGIRGAAAERSQKITLMKDGVLITPAPYSAPAAYYVPNVSRIAAVEVLKGPAAIRYGPHTVGGAINFLSPNIPEDSVSKLDVSAGSYGFQKLQLSSTGSRGSIGYFVDGLSYSSDGFKKLDGGGHTGFERTDLGGKFQYVPSDAQLEQVLTISVDIGNERANETYLGLTDADFVQDPNRRYRASQLDRFESEHGSVIFNYGVAITDTSRINLKAYYTEFDRSWNKLDGFEQGPSLQEVLSSPNLYSLEYYLLTGERDSDSLPTDFLDVTNNDRQYETRGLQAFYERSDQWSSWLVRTQLGLRAHKDQVRRLHSPMSYAMTDGRMVRQYGRDAKVENYAVTDALSSFASIAMSRGALTFEVGARNESIDGRLTNFLVDTKSESNQSITTPSFSFRYQSDLGFSLFGGVHKGFSPAGPGASADAEESVNLELGLRAAVNDLDAEILFFQSDYENLLGRCRVSDQNCTPGDEFNGGNVMTEGAEFSASLSRPVLDNLVATASVSYTFTEATFESSFFSNYVAWGIVQAGDQLPYIPEHSGVASLSLASERWSLGGSVKFQETMREVAGSSPIQDDLHADGFLILDVSARYTLSSSVELQVIAKNVTNETPIASHRPFGARPEMPRTLIGRVIYEF